MFTVDFINSTGATFRIAAGIISITCIFYTLLMQRRRSERTRLFLALLTIIIIDVFTGLTASQASALPFPYTARFIIIYVCKMIYYGTHFTLTYFLFVYLIYVCNLAFKYDKKIRAIMMIPISLTEILLLSNPFTNVCFTLHSDLTSSRGFGVYFAYLISAFYFGQCILILIKYWSTINHLKKLSMFYFMSLALIGVLIQMIFPDFVCELLCESIGLMGFMIMIEKEDDKIDFLTKAYNRAALFNDLNSFIKMGTPFKIVCIRIDNSEVYRRITGYENFDFVLVELAEFLMTLAGKNNVYKAGDANFFIICPKATNSDVLTYAREIDTRFRLGFTMSSGELSIVENILCASYPEQFETADDIVLLGDVPIEADSQKNIFINDELDFLIRNIFIEKAISTGINEGNFTVYYQPLFDPYTNQVKAIQALLKLNNARLGNINFNEFMPIAERAGFADTLEQRMIEAIFRFVGEELDAEGLNLDFVLIHLMSVKVVNKSLVETVMGLKYKYNISPSKIAFDIDDTILNFSNENLGYVLNELYNEGFSLFMGNYDISNLGQNEDVLNKFRGVILSAWKFLDKRFLDHGQVVLRTRADMLNQLDKEVVIIGVDSETFYNEVIDFKSKYVSGKFFSEPITKEELIEKFKYRRRRPSS
jgi:EAL domain-containing protein (putative c-di-GMP-specific phosphodiesterase class I)/GGDEF domain-containing protein